MQCKVLGGYHQLPASNVFDSTPLASGLCHCWRKGSFVGVGWIIMPSSYFVLLSLNLNAIAEKKLYEFQDLGRFCVLQPDLIEQKKFQV